MTVNNGQVPTSAQAQGNHTYAISFNPKEAKPHIVELKFNGEGVPGSPFKCLVVDAAKVSLLNNSRILSLTPTSYPLPPLGESLR